MSEQTCPHCGAESCYNARHPEHGRHSDCYEREIERLKRNFNQLNAEKYALKRELEIARSFEKAMRVALVTYDAAKEES